MEHNERIFHSLLGLGRTGFNVEDGAAAPNLETELKCRLLLKTVGVRANRLPFLHTVYKTIQVQITIFGFQEENYPQYGVQENHRVNTNSTALERKITYELVFLKPFLDKICFAV